MKLLPLAELIPSDADAGLAAFSYLAVPMTLERGARDGIDIVRADGTIEHHDGLVIPAQQSRELFARNGAIVRVGWTIGDQGKSAADQPHLAA